MDYGAIIQVIFGLVGEFMADGDKQKAEALLQQARRDFKGIQLPTLEEIEAQQLGQSALEEIRADPTIEGEQYEALGQVDELSQTGTGIQDRAALNTIANQLGRRQRAAAAGIEADMAGRGLQGSGIDYATRAQMGSDANQRLSEAGQNIAGDAANRRMQAILAKGDLSGKMRGQQYSEKANAAQARDAIMRFNAQSRDSANRYNKALPQQRFANQMQKTAAVANPTNALVANYNNNADSTRQLYGNAGAAAGTATNSAVNNWSSGNVSGESAADRKRREEDEMWGSR